MKRSMIIVELTRPAIRGWMTTVCCLLFPVFAAPVCGQEKETIEEKSILELSNLFDGDKKPSKRQSNR